MKTLLNFEVSKFLSQLLSVIMGFIFCILLKVTSNDIIVTF